MALNKSKYLTFVTLILTLSITLSLSAQTDKKEPIYKFETKHEIAHTPVKSQGQTSTCWSFATASYLESEMLRIGKKEVDLSEMFLVRNVYPIKAVNYVQLHGNTTFGPGSLCHDAFESIRKNGIVPEEVYPGKVSTQKEHTDKEMYEVLKAMLDAVLKKKGKKLTPYWLNAFNSVLDAYLGEVPAKFEYEGKSYTPKEFFIDYVELNLDDYIEISSFAHHPFYEQFRLEVPDNWSFNNDYYNIPIDELEAVTDHLLENGHSVALDFDLSEEEYATNKKGYAIVPQKNWNDKNWKEKEEKIKGIVEEPEITQEMRQETFENHITTDDHLMHIIGIAHDQEGNKFYKVKDSWHPYNENDGYIYLSRAYFRLKTISIMVNKNALPENVKSKILK